MGNERVVEYLQEASKISSHLSESSSSLQCGFDGQREKCRTVFFNVSDTLIKEPSQHLRRKTDGLPSANRALCHLPRLRTDMNRI